MVFSPEKMRESGALPLPPWTALTFGESSFSESAGQAA